MPKNKTFPLLYWRRISQTLFLLLFLVLFRLTDYKGLDQIPYAVNIFFRLDPLVAASAMLAARALISLLFLSLITIALTLLLGRFFCGWFCPLGTLLDLAHPIIRPKKGKPNGHRRSWKYLLLGFILAASFFGLPVVGYFDPFSLLVRGMAISIDPFFNYTVVTFFDVLYRIGPAWLSSISESIYAFFKDSVLAYNQKFFTLSLLSLFILATIFALEKIERRFWCKNLCPLGGLLSLLSRFSLLKGRIQTSCRACRVCTQICRMEAIDPDEGVSPENCNLCLDCLDRCPDQSIAFAFKKPAQSQTPLGVSRRAFIGTLGAGLVLPTFLKVRAEVKIPDPSLIRPPGALKETQFLDRCVRCGECMKICLNNALQPCWLESGVEGLFSPRLIPRIGYCEFNCTLCGQVCPTGAIQKLALTEKQKTVIGAAYFDRDRCLPYAKGTPCIVCEEHCPTSDKAIKFHETQVLNPEGKVVTIKQPYVIESLCIGCGICENKCPLEGKAGVLVISNREGKKG
jgi:polyferredoxin/formate hydrogenlyase subunit 6/NADH:ubiquinone oxidoreductase subunit I